METKEELLKEGGDWLGAVRAHIQHAFLNGEHVTWGSQDVLNPPVTVKMLEEAAAVAVAADRNRTSGQTGHWHP